MGKILGVRAAGRFAAVPCFPSGGAIERGGLFCGRLLDWLFAELLADRARRYRLLDKPG